MDIEQAALDVATRELNAGEKLLAVMADVRDAAAMEALAVKVEAHFGPAGLLFNNAGVGGGRWALQQGE